MEIIDFLAFGLYAVLFAITLLVVRFTLKRTGRKREKHLFMDAVYIWLTWVVSSLAALLLLAILDSNTHISFKLPTLVFAAIVVFCVFGGNVLATIWVTWRLVKRDDENEVFLFEAEEAPRVETPNIILTSFSTTIAATLTLILLIGVVRASVSAYEYFYPKPKTEIGIYDI